MTSAEVGPFSPGICACKLGALRWAIGPLAANSLKYGDGLASIPIFAVSSLSSDICPSKMLTSKGGMIRSICREKSLVEAKMVSDVAAPLSPARAISLVRFCCSMSGFSLESSKFTVAMLPNLYKISKYVLVRVSSTPTADPSVYVVYAMKAAAALPTTSRSIPPRWYTRTSRLLSITRNVDRAKRAMSRLHSVKRARRMARLMRRLARYLWLPELALVDSWATRFSSSSPIFASLEGLFVAK